LFSFVLLPSKTTPLGGAILPGGIDERSLIPCRHCLPLHEAGVMFVAPTCCASLWSLLFIVRVALVVVGDRKSIISWCYPPLLPFPFKDSSPWMASDDGTWSPDALEVFSSALGRSSSPVSFDLYTLCRL
jgi:hypothetical protein